MEEKAPLIFIYSGGKLPKYANYAMRFAVLHSGLKIIMLCDALPQKKVLNIEYTEISGFYDPPCYIRDFDPNIISFRNSFWLKTVERFFILEQYIRAKKLNKVFHAELDNLIFDISLLEHRLDRFGEGLFIPRDSVDRAIASLIYVNCPIILKKLCQSIEKSGKFFNDMQLLGRFMDANTDYTYSLPVIPKSILDSNRHSQNIDSLHESDIGGIFDAAGFGQWLFGIDPRNSAVVVRNMFKNECTSFPIEELLFRFIEEQHKFYVCNSSGECVNLYNLHVHSKAHKKILKGRFLWPTITKINKNEKTVISWNIWRQCRSHASRLKQYLKQLIGLH